VMGKAGSDLEKPGMRV